MKILEQTTLPTRFGEFQMIAIESDFPDFPHIVLKTAEFNSADDVLVRIHSECMTGDVFGSARCDCGEQLDSSLEQIGESSGVLIYLRQEGRGIGLVNKMKAYNLQDQGLDTYDANVKLGFHQDARNFDIAVEILDYLKVSEIHLLTNNPEKLKTFDNTSVKVLGRKPLLTHVTTENKKYLETKKNRMGHFLDSL